MSSGNDPAFPVEVTHKTDGTICGVQTGSRQGWEMGLTKRELFAAMAMHGLVTRPIEERGDKRDVAYDAVNIADALIEELSKGGDS